MACIGLFGLAACVKEADVAGPTVGMLKSSVILPYVDREMTLDGLSRFEFYWHKEKRFVNNVDSLNEGYVKCMAKMWIGSDLKVELTTYEYAELDGVQFVYRVYPFKGKIHPNGNFKLQTPSVFFVRNLDTWMFEERTNAVDALLQTTCIDIRGNGIAKDVFTYNGFFNDGKLWMETSAVGTQTEEWTSMLPPFNQLLNGAVSYKNSFSLHLVE